MKYVLIVLGLMAVALCYSIIKQDKQLLLDVQTGRVQLVCNDKVVPPEKVVRFSDRGWEFTNGYAVNCELQ